jgi:hypothetical protein
LSSVQQDRISPDKAISAADPSDADAAAERRIFDALSQLEQRLTTVETSA